MPIYSEQDRLNALRELRLLDTPYSECFDRITRMASRFFAMPISAISLTDADRQWFKSHIGTVGRDLPRFQAPCAEVATSREALIVPDLLDDPRFRNSPLAHAGVRFYAGAPLVTHEGYGLGAMCVLDTKPHEFASDQANSLRDLAAMVMAQVELQHDFGRIDPASGLPNRRQMMNDLRDAARLTPGWERTALLIDLADPAHLTHTVNVLGAGYIDELSRTAGRVLRDVLGWRASLYQVGTTTYAAVLDRAPAVWRNAMDALNLQLRAPIWCAGVPIPISAAYGVAPFHLGGIEPEDVLRIALAAAHDARRGASCYAI